MRLDSKEHHSVWFFRRDYNDIYTKIINDLHFYNYRFEPVKKIIFDIKDQPPAWVWHAQNAWIIKSLSLYLQDNLNLNSQIFRLRVIKQLDKKYIGRRKKRFDLLGFYIDSQKIVDFAQSTKDRISSKIYKFYEQSPNYNSLQNYIKSLWAFVKRVTGTTYAIAYVVPVTLFFTL